MPQIDLRNIRKEFGGWRGARSWTALTDVDLSVETGEIVGILGPSGCGKSTLLNIVAGLETQYDGEFTIQGKTIEQQIEAGFRVAYVFQEARLLPWRTVRGNIEFALKASKFPQNESRVRVDRILELVELSKFAHFYPQQLSGGMQQRVSIARAFAIEPDILLMDEPFSALDEMTAQHLRESLLKIWSAFRTTIVFVSHNALEASFLADRVMIMSHGPAGTIRQEISLAGVRRPRSYDDLDLIEKSRAVVSALRKHSGRSDPVHA
ncbi:ABC transporter ATP-binding protein [Pseudorhodoplanes sinuspersici]|uniref:ABC transporter ATP-binding protein n=1 Tax=Pseudorhodoplanes sinuspersici TaxID=1235591 RepID=UPI0012FD4B99|nr:ABC transporter ATP-binding protein [Pseudorhodoplanes sinuspersici]